MTKVKIEKLESDFKKETAKARDIYWYNAKIIKETKRGNLSFYTIDRKTKQLKWTRVWTTKPKFRAVLRSSLGYEKKKIRIKKIKYNKYIFKRTIHSETVRLKKPKEKITISNIIYTKGQARTYNILLRRNRIPMSLTDRDIKQIVERKRRNVLGLIYKDPKEKLLRLLKVRLFTRRMHEESP